MTQKVNNALVCLCGGPGLNYSETLVESFRFDSFDIFCFKQTNVKSIKELIFNLDQFVDSIGYENIFLLGHSFGGVLIIEYLSKFERKITKAIILNSPLDATWTDVFYDKYALYEKARFVELETLNLSGDDYYQRSTQIYAPLYFSTYNSEAKSFLRSIQYNYQLVSNLSGYMGSFDLTNLFKKLKLDILFLYSSDDQIILSEHIQQKSDLLLQSNLYPRKLDKVGHFSFVDDLKLVKNEIECFLLNKSSK